MRLVAATTGTAAHWPTRALGCSPASCYPCGYARTLMGEGVHVKPAGLERAAGEMMG